MLTDKDIQKLKEELATKEEFKTLATAVASVATSVASVANAVTGVANDLAGLEKKFDVMGDAINALPTKEELANTLASTYELAKLKIEHDHMKRVMHEKLHVEI